MSNPVQGNQSFAGVQNNGNNFQSLNSDTVNTSNLVTNTIKGGTSYIYYNGAINSNIMVDINTTTIFIVNTTSITTYPVIIEIPNGSKEGQIIAFSPTNQYSVFTISGNNFYAEDSYTTNATNALIFVWSNVLRQWNAICNY